MPAVRPSRLTVLIVVFILAGIVILVWAVHESARQRQEIEHALATQASILALSLEPGLVAASNAARELDEIVAWKLLDNARLLAELHRFDAPSRARLEELAEANGLDSVVYVDRQGAVERLVGDETAMRLAADLESLLSGAAEELVLRSTIEADVEHIAAAVALPGGGAALVRAHESTAKTFARRLGVENLLQRLVGSRVLYLSYREEPGSLQVESTWDGGPLPPPSGDTRLHEVRGKSVFEVEIPASAPAGRAARIRVGLDGVPLQQAAAAATRRTLLIGLVLAGFGLVGITAAGVSHARTLERAEAARRLAAVEAARRSSARLAAAGTLTAGLAHEVRSPMNAINLAAQRLERHLQGRDEPQSMARRIRGEVQRLEAILREFLEFASPVSDHRRDTDLAELARQVLELLEVEAQDRSVRLGGVRGTAQARIDEDAIRRSLINLVRNAIQATPPGGAVDVEVQQDTEMATIRVLDEGPGIDPRDREKLFDAFFTTRVSGTGLGLALVRRVAEEHGGQVELRNRPTTGAEAVFQLPLSRRRTA
jgi:signal transduction histidine kinase